MNNPVIANQRVPETVGLLIGTWARLRLWQVRQVVRAAPARSPAADRMEQPGESTACAINALRVALVVAMNSTFIGIWYFQTFLFIGGEETDGIRGHVGSDIEITNVGVGDSALSSIAET